MLSLREDFKVCGWVSAWKSLTPLSENPFCYFRMPFNEQQQQKVNLITKKTFFNKKHLKSFSRSHFIFFLIQTIKFQFAKGWLRRNSKKFSICLSCHFRFVVWFFSPISENCYRCEIKSRNVRWLIDFVKLNN